MSYGHKELVEFLLSRGADVNARAIYGTTPLFQAYRRGNVEIARILLRHGADRSLEYGGRKIPQSFLDRVAESLSE